MRKLQVYYLLMFKNRKKISKKRMAEAIEMVAVRKGIPLTVSMNMTISDMKRLFALILRLPKK